MSLRVEESGWTTTAISPSASQYPISEPFAGEVFESNGLSSDFTSSQWVEATTGQYEMYELGEVTLPALAGIYLRRSNGPVAEVGPLLPSLVDPRVVGKFYFTLDGASSGDLSDVFYSMSAEHWPGDESEPGAESLYEYIGTGNSAPGLVGLSGGAGSTNLVSRCGTSFNGVSEDGGVVLFAAHACGSSPAVQELYERVENGRPGAHTVAISEPSKEDCAECDIEAAVREPASVVSVVNEEGANRSGPSTVGLSGDGSRVFFTTSQRLLGGDESKNLYEYDSENEARRRVVRISGGDSTVSEPIANLESVLSISPDGSHVYFTASGVLTSTPNSIGQKAQAGQSNLYLYERDAQFPDGRTVFVLPYTDIVNVGSLEKRGDVSQDGRFIVFNSDAHLTPDDLSSGPQAFEYDSQTGGFVRVSIGQNGFSENGNLGQVEYLLVANDGAVFFESANPLVPQATNGLFDVYEYREGNVNLISDGQEIHSPGEEGGENAPRGLSFRPGCVL